MAKLKYGITGPISGKIGPVVGSNWKGIAYIKSKGRSSKPNAPLQKQQQAKLTIMNAFVIGLADVLRIGFTHVNLQKTWCNNAMSYNMKNAITGTAPFFDIDYSRVMISRGNLPNATDVQLPGIINRALQFTWTNNTGSGIAKPKDRCMLVAWCPALKKGTYALPSIRSAEAATLDVSIFAGNRVVTWIAFISAKGNEVSDSIYVGDGNVD